MRWKSASPLTTGLPTGSWPHADSVAISVTLKTLGSPSRFQTSSDVLGMTGAVYSAAMRTASSAL